MAETGKSDPTPRLLVCYVAGEQAMDRYPTMVRYLQIGLLDEAIDAVLLAPQHPRAETLIGGPTPLLAYARSRWPFGRSAHRRLLGQVQAHLEGRTAGGPVLVHCLDAESFVMAAELAQALGAELIAFVASLTDVRVIATSLGVERISTIVTPSMRLRDALNNSPLAGVTTEVIRPGAGVASSFAAFASSQVAPSLIFAGELVGDSGVDSLLRAVRRVLQYHPNLLAFIVGQGPAEPRLRRLTEALDMNANVIFAGPLDHWRRVIESADLFCLPRARAAFSEIPIHALAVGLAIVAVDNSVYDGLEDERTALLFPEHDEARLADQICRLLDDRELTRRLAAAAQAYARANHSIARMVAEHVRIYRRLESRAKTIPLAAAR